MAAAAPTGGTRRRTRSTRRTPAILAEDTRIYVTLAARMCLPEVIPYDFVAGAQDFLRHLAPSGKAAGQYLDLRRSSRPPSGCRGDAAERCRTCPMAPEAPRSNDGLTRLARIVNPALYHDRWALRDGPGAATAGAARSGTDAGTRRARSGDERVSVPADPAAPPAEPGRGCVARGRRVGGGASRPVMTDDGGPI